MRKRFFLTLAIAAALGLGVAACEQSSEESELQPTRDESGLRPEESEGSEAGSQSPSSNPSSSGAPGTTP